MLVKDMRIALKNAPKYGHSMKWHDKVDRMKDEQVMAVYFRMKRDGDLEPIQIRIVKNHPTSIN